MGGTTAAAAFRESSPKVSPFHKGERKETMKTTTVNGRREKNPFGFTALLLLLPLLRAVKPTLIKQKRSPSSSFSYLWDTCVCARPKKSKSALRVLSNPLSLAAFPFLPPPSIQSSLPKGILLLLSCNYVRRRRPPQPPPPPPTFEPNSSAMRTRVGFVLSPKSPGLRLHDDSAGSKYSTTYVPTLALNSGRKKSCLPMCGIGSSTTACISSLPSHVPSLLLSCLHRRCGGGREGGRGEVDLQKPSSSLAEGP